MISVVNVLAQWILLFVAEKIVIGGRLVVLRRVGGVVRLRCVRVVSPRTRTFDFTRYDSRDGVSSSQRMTRRGRFSG